MPTATRQDAKYSVEINYEVIGSGEPLVLHHGNGNSIQDWHSLGFVEKLIPHYQLILIDSRGYGASSKFHNTDAYSLKSKADDTVMVLDELGIKKAHCLGASVGAATCMLLARFHPDRFLSFIFATPYFTLYDEALKTALKDGKESYFAKMEELVGGSWDNEPTKKTILANDIAALLAVNSGEWFDYQDYIQYVKVPSLIYAGELEPSITALAELSKQLPNCTLKIIPGLDHKDMYWQSEVAAPLILGFLDK